jgi:hypothetical protein
MRCESGRTDSTSGEQQGAFPALALHELAAELDSACPAAAVPDHDLHPGHVGLARARLHFQKVAQLDLRAAEYETDPAPRAILHPTRVKLAEGIGRVGDKHAQGLAQTGESTAFGSALHFSGPPQEEREFESIAWMKVKILYGLARRRQEKGEPRALDATSIGIVAAHTLVVKAQ